MNTSLRNVSGELSINFEKLPCDVNFINVAFKCVIIQGISGNGLVTLHISWKQFYFSFVIKLVKNAKYIFN